MEFVSDEWKMDDEAEEAEILFNFGHRLEDGRFIDSSPDSDMIRDVDPLSSPLASPTESPLSLCTTDYSCSMYGIKPCFVSLLRYDDLILHRSQISHNVEEAKGDNVDDMDNILDSNGTSPPQSPLCTMHTPPILHSPGSISTPNFVSNNTGMDITNDNIPLPTTPPPIQSRRPTTDLKTYGRKKKPGVIRLPSFKSNNRRKVNGLTPIKIIPDTEDPMYVNRINLDHQLTLTTNHQSLPRKCKKSPSPIIGNMDDSIDSFPMDEFTSISPKKIIAYNDDDNDEDFQLALRRSRLEFDVEWSKLEASLPNPPSGVELTDLMTKKVNDTYALQADLKIISAFSLTIKRSDLERYKRLEWLDDVNIDFYLEMIRARNEKKRSEGFLLPRIYVFQSYFFKLCSRTSFEVVQQTTDDNIFEYDMAFFPVHICHHWRLIVADFRRRTLLCYDSMYRFNGKHLDVIAKYLEDEYRAKVETHLELEIPESVAMTPESESEEIHLTPDSIQTNQSCNVTRPISPSITITTMSPPTAEVYFENWRKDTVDPAETGIPQQENGYDCGIFLCQYAESLARGIELPFDFTQINMLYFRYLMAWETLEGKLTNRKFGPCPTV